MIFNILFSEIKFEEFTKCLNIPNDLKFGIELEYCNVSFECIKKLFTTNMILSIMNAISIPKDLINHIIRNNDFDKKNEDGVPELSSIVEDNDKKQSKIKPSEDAEKLLKLIEEKQAEKQQKQEVLKQQQEKVKVESEDKDLPKEEDIKTFIVDNEIFEIVSKSNFTDKLGCYLVKNSNGYAIMGFVGEKVFKIKSYERLKTEKLQTRASEKLNDGTIRYIVRIGMHKFILNVKDDNMEYVMDLC